MTSSPNAGREEAFQFSSAGTERWLLSRNYLVKNQTDPIISSQKDPGQILEMRAAGRSDPRPHRGQVLASFRAFKVWLIPEASVEEEKQLTWELPTTNAQK
jgi:hypothetical protein